MPKWVVLNEQFLKEENALLHFSDLAFMRGYGIFDFFRLLGNQPLFIEDHLDRFYYSAEKMHLPVPISRVSLKKNISELIEENNLPDTGVRLSLTGGYSKDGFSLGKPNLLISQHVLRLPTPQQQINGTRLISYSFQRQLPDVKSIDYLMAIWLQPLQIQHFADDILYHQNGKITECPRSNFFMITQDDRIITPLANILQGITRKKLLEVAKRYFSVEERPIDREELKKAKEAFITSTSKQILPVSKVDDILFKERRMCNHLLELFQSAYC